MSATPAVAYDFNAVPPQDRDRVKLVVQAFTNWHDATVVTDADVSNARKAMREMSIRTTPGPGMLYFRLDEITSLHPYAGGPGVIAPDGTVRGRINSPAGGTSIEVTFNILANPIVINPYRDPSVKPKSLIEKLQELAKAQPELGAMLASPEALVAAMTKAAAEGDTAAVAILFVPGSLGKVAGREDLDNLTILTIGGLQGLQGLVMGEKL